MFFVFENSSKLEKYLLQNSQTVERSHILYQTNQIHESHIKISLLYFLISYEEILYTTKYNSIESKKKII